MVRRFRGSLAVWVAGALVSLSPGLEPYRALAVELHGGPSIRSGLPASALRGRVGVPTVPVFRNSFGRSFGRSLGRMEVAGRLNSRLGSLNGPYALFGAEFHETPGLGEARMVARVGPIPGKSETWPASPLRSESPELDGIAREIGSEMEALQFSGESGPGESWSRGGERVFDILVGRPSFQRRGAQGVWETEARFGSGLRGLASSFGSPNRRHFNLDGSGEDSAGRAINSVEIISQPQTPEADSILKDMEGRFRQGAGWDSFRHGLGLKLGAAFTAGVVSALAWPWILAHAGAAGLALLVGSGVPLIITNVLYGKQVTRDLAPNAFLSWFAAAVLLTAASLLTSPLDWTWISTNLAGVAQSLTVLFQINWTLRDPKILTRSLWTVAGSLGLSALALSGLFFPAAVWASWTLMAALGLVFAINYQAIRFNHGLYRSQGRGPDRRIVLYPAMIVAGGLLQLIEAVAQGNLRWIANIVVSVATVSVVVGQILAPRPTNALIGPLMELIQKAKSWIMRWVQQAKAALVSAWGGIRK